MRTDQCFSLDPSPPPSPGTGPAQADPVRGAAGRPKPVASKCSLRREKALRAGGCPIVAGIDEAGRGPLAGPVVAAIVILPDRFRHRTLRDSKQLSAKQREEIYAELTGRKDVFWAV